MVKEIIILRETGILLFHYSVSGTRRLDELVAAFLSAVGSFAKEVSQDKIMVMSFAKDKLVWEKQGDLYFIALVSQEDSGEIHRVILQDLAQQFVSKYYGDLMKELPDSKRFRPFADVVEMTLQKFNGIPGLARRYKTVLLPAPDLNRLKRVLHEMEVNRDIHRGALIISDGYVATSNLRAYELEAVLDLIHTTDEEIAMLEHSSLDRNTAFLLTRVPDKGTCVFVVNTGMSEQTYLELISPFVTLVRHTDFAGAKRFEPDKTEGPISFYNYDSIEPITDLESIIQEAQILFASETDTFRTGLLRMINRLGKETTVAELHEAGGLPREQGDEILAQLIARGLVRVTKIFPIIGERDERFIAYLEVIGIKKRDFAVVESIWKHCNGAYSLREISERTNVPASRILEVLRALGNYVTWSKERVIADVR
ncbi:MAG: hypothetical protein DRP09_00040 [Candidatus Thorarchaeota archaeon]|nr:MAG: hypothetical protein DRP09_00040 [Candidatus Thorarchaeota archaeon]